ncbi:MAG TPA: cation:proton antiporter [Candidatus Limnocylindria bacterium]|nr:cation:proton antiporter [Candidatus Limnocylindria bacterium]
MLLSLALVFLCGGMLGKMFEALKLPRLLGMLATGVILGPQLLDLLDPKILDISTDLRQLALIIILARAGLSLNLDDLRKVGRPAILMCFVPAVLEILAMLAFAPMLLGVSLLDAAVMGTVVAAVSPAVIVPRMLRLMEKGYGVKKRIPQMILAGASVDDVFVIVLFTAFAGLAQGGDLSPVQFLSVPSSIALGLAGGAAAGLVLARFFKAVHIRDSAKVIIILSVAFLFVSLEHAVSGPIGFSGLLAVMAAGGALRHRLHIVATRLSAKLSKLWVAAELILFVLVGAAVDVGYAARAGLAAVLLILIVLAFRLAGVFLSLLGTDLDRGERVFTGLAYLPKATVQAAIGGLPLAMGLASGNVILTVAVLSIIITAPLGASLIDTFYRKLLTKEALPPAEPAGQG